MPIVLQWIIVIALTVIIYFGYIHGFIKHIRSDKVKVGMTESEVYRLIGKPVKETRRGHKVVATYSFRYANRLSPETFVRFRVVYVNKVVTDIYR